MRVVALDDAHFAAWAKLFEACHAPCFCRYWHFAGDKNAWLARCAFEPEKNRDEQASLVRACSPEARGLVAIDDAGAAIGWMKLAPRASLAKLRRQGAYRSLDLGADDGVYSVGCFLVHPDHRRRGVARALLRAAPDFVRAWGGGAIEAYPRRSPDALRDDEMAQGPAALFVELGFAPVFDDGPYPVLRLTLAPSACA
jgi:GNAT superfamily N-acetyltransferase